MTPVTEGDFTACSAADPEPFGTGTCLLQTLNQDLCNFFPLFRTTMCLPELLARQSEIPSARSICWYKTCYPLTQGPPAHVIWSLLKPSRWSLLISAGCTVLPCSEVSKGSHLQAGCCLSLCVVGGSFPSGREAVTLAQHTPKTIMICWEGLLRARGSLAQQHLCMFLQLAQPKEVSHHCVVVRHKAPPSCKPQALQVPCNLWKGGLCGGECHLLGQASDIMSED